jgi:hypothetical protein
VQDDEIGSLQQREKDLKLKATEVAKLEAEEIERLETECKGRSSVVSKLGGKMDRLQAELREKSGLLREATNAGANVVLFRTSSMLTPLHWCAAVEKLDAMVRLTPCRERLCAFACVPLIPCCWACFS